MEKSGSSRFRRAALFVALAVIIQAIFVVLLTPQGLSAIYPYLVRQSGEQIKTEDNSFQEYFELRREFADSEAFFIGADTAVADSYEVILDYLRFTNRFFGVSHLALGVHETTARRINDCLNAKTSEQYNEAMALLASSGRFTAEFLSFVSRLCRYNSNLALNVHSIYVPSVQSVTSGRISSLVMSGTTQPSAQVSYSVSIRDVDEFFDYFNENSDAFAQFLGDEEYDYFRSVEEHYRAGDYEEWALCEKIKPLVGEKTLFVVDPETAGDYSAFRAGADSLGVKCAFVQVKYVGCRALSTDGNLDKNDLDLPFAPDRGILFVSGEKIEWFRKYYRFVANPSGNESRLALQCALDAFSTRHFFIVVGSPAAAYGEGTN